MHRIDGPGATGGNLFTEGSPPTTPATTVTDDWLNDIQEEICNFIESRGITLVKADQNQLQKAILSSQSQANNAKLTRNSATQFQAESQQAGVRDKLTVDGEEVDLSTPKTCVVSGGGVANLLASDGTDSAGTPAGTTLYYAYISNSQASFAPSTLRLSATAPTNGYLAASGNGANWRFVGAVYLDGSIQIANPWNLCGYGEDTLEKELTSNIVRTSGTLQWYSAVLMEDVVLLENTVLTSLSRLTGRWDVVAGSIQGRLSKNGVVVRAFAGAQAGSNYNDIVPVPHAEKQSSIVAHDIDLEYNYFQANQLTVNQNSSMLLLKRSTL